MMAIINNSATANKKIAGGSVSQFVISSREYAHPGYCHQCSCCDCVLFRLARLERSAARAPAVRFVQNHLEMVPLSHVGAACRSVLSKNEASGGLSGWRLFDIYPHAGA